MDVVGDDELLYRRIPYRTDHPFYYARQPDGTIRLSASAFGDRNRRISVDRARLTGNQPSRSLSTPNDGVVSVVAHTIRAESIAANDSRGRPVETHMLDVIPAPLPENPAHAEIVANPDITSKSAFERLKQMLVRLAEWEIYPLDCRPDNS